MALKFAGEGITKREKNALTSALWATFTSLSGFRALRAAV